MSIHLLDVNVLLALVDRLHPHHGAAREWLKRNRSAGWATCPLTENGFVRILSNPQHPSRFGNSAVPLDLLMRLCEEPNHHFWADEVRIADVVTPGVTFGHKHVTDIYLLGLAVHKGGRLATLDRRIPASLVVEGEKALTVIPI